jgi:hypothetical protein
MVSKGTVTFTSTSMRESRPVIYVTYAGMIGLIFLALYYYKLRVGFSDTPYNLMDMTRNGGFTMGHNRFINYFYEIFPAILIRFGASLRAVAIAYSLNFTLFPILLAIVSIQWFKRPYIGLAIVLQSLVMNVLLFYYPVSELQIGLAVLMFLHAFFDYVGDHPSKSYLFVGLSLVILPTLAFAHPMMLPSFAGWVLYRILRKEWNYRLLLITAAIFFIAIVVKRLWFISGYEVGKGLSWETVRPFGLNYYAAPFATSFYKYILGEAFVMPGILLLTMAMLIYRKRWKMLTFLLLTIIALLTVVMIAFEDFGTHFYDHYYEHMLQPVVFFLLLIFCEVLETNPIKSWIKTTVLTFIVLISLAKINSGSESHFARQKWMYTYLNLMDKMGLKKAILGRINIPDGMIMASFWSASTESLFLSALEGPQKAKTLFMPWDINVLYAPAEATDLFIMDGWNFPQSTIPKKYFELDNRPYVILDKVIPDTVLRNMKYP